jgi:pimeloyl-ACP methyl ester carboxylesterase
MGQDNIDEFGAALKGEVAVSEFLEKAAADLAQVTGPVLADALGGLASAVDKAALTGELADVLAESFRQSVSTGIAGWRDDDLAFTRPWGFELKSLRVPVAIWQGAQDLMVPFDHGRWLAANVAGAQARLLDDEGHISLLNHIDRILEDLVELGTAGG